MSIEPTTRLVEFLVGMKYEDIPPSSLTATKRELLDIVGTTLAGNLAPGCPEVVSLVKEWGGAEESTIIGYGRKVPSPFAALANGTMAHAWDFDDTHDQAVLHAGVSVIPAALAIAERKGKVSGRDFLCAVVLGIEMVCRMGMATKFGPNTTGWMLTPLYGYFGAAAAAGKILGLDAERMHHCLGIAYSQAAGNVQCVLDGALTKRFQAGFAAQGGTLAALLAQKGVTGAKEIIQGRFGLYNVYQRGDLILEALIDSLGKNFAVENLSFKPYPCCRFIHSTIDAAKELFQRRPGLSKDIQEITISVNQQAYNAVCHPLTIKSEPRTIVDAQFSIPYATAVALIKGRVTLDDFAEKAIRNPGVIALAKKVCPRVDEEIEKMSSREISPAILEVKTERGGSYSQRIDIPKGHPRNPLSDEELAAKFRDCSRHAARPLPEENLNRLIDMIYSLEKLDDLTQLIKNLE
ncbi:MAG: MmgE/PrpD family protein [Deltaproteobacteria bacterium]|nr:MmgE/PrpD family protein [Deltaproteobacteria bacterium]